MKLSGLLLAFLSVAAQDGERGKNNAEEKGPQSCLGVQVSQADFKCKHKKKKDASKRKRCVLVCPEKKMKKIFCNEDGWGGKGGKKVNPSKLC